MATRRSTRATTASAVVITGATLVLVVGCAAPSPPRAQPPAASAVSTSPAEPTSFPDTAAGGVPSGAVEFASPAEAETAAAAAAPPVVIIDDTVPLGADHECAGVDGLASEPSRLSVDDDVTGIVVCDSQWAYLPGDGTWRITGEHRVPDADLDTVADALRRPDEVAEPDTGCSLIGVLTPAVTVETTDGRRLNASIPRDPCHPQRDVLELLGGVITDQPAENRWRTERLQSEAELTSSCRPQEEKVGFITADGLLQPPDNAAPLTVPPEEADSGAAACLYGPAGPPAEPGMLDLLGQGTVDAALRDRLIASVTRTRPADRPGCTPADPWAGTAEGDTHLVLASPVTRWEGVPQPGSPFLALETGPCARVLDGGYQLAGWADPALVQQIRALARG